MIGRKMPYPGRPCSAATLTDITAARIDNAAATGIDHLKTPAIIDNTVIAANLFSISIRFTDIGFSF
jgi:hypothetical protein